MARNSKNRKPEELAEPEIIGKVVSVKDKEGADRGLSEVVAYYDGPVYILAGVDGTRYVWLSALCEETEDADVAKYWLARFSALQNRVAISNAVTPPAPKEHSQNSRPLEKPDAE